MVAGASAAVDIIVTGNGLGVSGNITFQTGSSAKGGTGSVLLSAGATSTGTGGVVSIDAGTGVTVKKTGEVSLTDGASATMYGAGSYNIDKH